MGVERPKLADQRFLPEVIRAARERSVAGTVQKSLVFAPDAIGAGLFEKHRSMFDEVLLHAPLRVSLRSVFPPKTPICWASMFTGAPPEVHGIRKPEKPVLQCDTLFDALVRAGKKVAIIAVADSSMERIFRERDLDYFAEPYDPQPHAWSASSTPIRTTSSLPTNNGTMT